MAARKASAAGSGTIPWLAAVASNAAKCAARESKYSCHSSSNSAHGLRSLGSCQMLGDMTSRAGLGSKVTGLKRGATLIISAPEYRRGLLVRVITGPEPSP